MANKENILRVAAMIADSETRCKTGMPMRFNMNRYVVANECNTAACIAGYSAVANGMDIRNPDRPSDGIRGSAARFLGIEGDQLWELFTPHDDMIGPIGCDTLYQVQPAQAIAVLHHLAETGEVDWSVAPQRVKEVYE